MAVTINVSSGVTSSNIAINYEMIAKIYSAGTANSFTVNESGIMMVLSGGSASATTVGNMGSMFISAGGIISNTSLGAGAVINNFTVASGHTMTNGVSIRNATVQSGNQAYLFNGQSADAIEMSAGALLHVSSGGRISNLNVSSGAEIRLMDGITISNATLLVGAVINGFTVQSLTTDAYKISGAVASGSALVNAKRKVISAEIVEGGNVSVTSAGVLSRAQIQGAVHVFSSGLLERAVNSGTINVFGGTASLIEQNGLLNVSSGGLVSGVTQFAGGSMNVDNSGFVSSAVISDGSAVISAGGSMNLVTMTGGSMYVSAGAVENFDVANAYVSVGNYYISKGNDGRDWIIGAVSGVVSSAMIGSSGFMEVKQGTLRDVTVTNQGSVFMAVGNTVENLVISSGGVVSEGNYISAAYKTNNFSNTTVLSGGVLNGFTAVDSNIMISGVVHRNVEVYAADQPAELLHDEQVENGVVKSGGTIHLSSSTVASISDLTVESGGFIHVEEDAVLVLNGKTTLNNSGGVVLSRHIIHYTDLYSNAVDVFKGNVGTSCYSPVNGLLTAVISGTSYSRSSQGADWGSGTKIASYSIDPFTPTVNYTDNYAGGFYHSNVTFIPLNGMSSDGLSMITGGDVVSSVWIINAGGSQARVRFDFTSTTLAPNEAMLNDISRITPYDTGVDSKSLVPDQYHDDPRFEFVYTADLKDAYYLADGAEGFGVYQYDGAKYSHVYNETFRLVDSNGVALFPQQLNVDGNLDIFGVKQGISWDEEDTGITVTAILQKENSHLYMELYRNDSSSSATIDISEGPSYFLTSDTVFAGDKTYYTYAGGVYTSAAVTSGSAIAADTYYEKKYTNADVVVAAQYSQNTRFGTKKYDLQLIGDAALNNQVYKVYDGVTFSKNGTVTFKGTGADANEVSETLTVDWIDKAAPTITCSQEPVDWTPNSVYVKATAEENTTTTEYAVSGLNTQLGIEYKLSEDGDWLPYNTETGVRVEKNGDIYFRTWDMAGNMATQTHTVHNIITDLPAPVIFDVSPTSPTNQNVTISLQFDPYAAAYQVSVDGGAFTDITGVSGYVVNYTAGAEAGKTNTSTYTFRNSYGGGIYSPVVECSVDIDKKPPAKPVVKPSTEKEIVPKETGVVLTVTWADDAVVREYSEDDKVTWKNYTDSLEYNFNQTVYFRGEDAVGNVSDIAEYKISNIAVAEAPEAVPDTTEYTKKPVQITVSQAEGDTTQMIYQYQFVDPDGTVIKDWTEFDRAKETISVYLNADVHIRAIQEGTGYSSLVTVVSVTNVDTSDPVFESISYQRPSQADSLTVEVSTSDEMHNGVKSTEYTVDGGKSWKSFESTTEDGYNFSGSFTIDKVKESDLPVSFQVRVTDQVGNQVLSNNYNIGPLTITPSATGWTDSDVEITVKASDQTVSMDYSIDNGTSWTQLVLSEQTGSFILKQNADIIFKTIDGDKNEFEHDPYSYTWIDKVAPVINSLDWNPNWTNAPVTVTVSASDAVSGVAKIEYMFDGSAWQEISYTKEKTAGSFTLTGTGTFGVRVTDNAGKKVEQSGTVQIDEIAPVIESVSWDKALTKGPVTVTMSAYDLGGSGIKAKGYSLDGGQTWTEFPGDTFEIKSNCNVRLGVTDFAGNGTPYDFIVDNIDSDAPVIDSLNWNPNWTNAPVTVTVSASDAVSGVAKIEYTFEGSPWQEITYTQEKTAGSFTLTESGAFGVRVTDNVGNEVLQGGSVLIDMTKPVMDVSIDSSLLSPVIVTVTAYDTISGLAKKIYSINGGAWTEFADTFNVTENGVLRVLVYDNAGNIASYSKNLSGIPYIVRRDGAMSFNATMPGSYSVVGDFGNVTGSISVTNGAQTFFGTITQGVLNFGMDNSIQLAAGETSVAISVTNGSLYEYSVCFYPNAIPVAPAADDINGDGRADVTLSITQPGHSAYGSTGAWLILEDQTASWGDLSTFSSGWEIFGNGRTVAGKQTSDVYLRSSGNVIGAWVTGNDGKVSGWETIGEFDANTQIIGLGDFNGNGQTDLLLRNVNGAVGCYFTGGEKSGWNYFQSLGDEWKLSAIGDLNGDGRDDVVLKHDAGFAGSWLTQADGTMAWTDLDTLPGGFEIVGTGDFNGDGTDDVLLKSGNYYGAWLVNNGNAAGWMGLGDLGNITVEQIADFNGDRIDDLRIRTAAGDIGTQLVLGADNLAWQYYGSVGGEWSTALAAL